MRRLRRQAIETRAIETTKGGWLAWVAGFACAATTVLLWLALRAEVERTTQAHAAAEASGVVRHVMGHVQERSEGVARFARRAASSGQSAEARAADFAQYRLSYPDLLGVAILAGTTVRWSEPADVPGLDFVAPDAEPGVTRLAAIRSPDRPLYGWTTALPGGGGRTVVFVSDGRALARGFLAGGGDRAAGRIELAGPDGVLAVSGAGDRETRDIVQSVQADLRMRFTPRALDAAARLPVLVLAAGLLMSVLVTWSLRSTRSLALHAERAREDARRAGIAEQAERSARNLFEGVFDASADAILVIGEGGSIVRANATTERVIGWGRESLVGRSVDVLVPAARRASHEGCRTAYMKDPAARPMSGGRPLTACRPDGSEVEVEIALAPVVLPDGQGVLATIRDVSERRAAQAALQRSEERYRRFFESTPAGTCITRPDGEIEAYNAEFARLFRVAAPASGGVPPAPALYADPLERRLVLDEIDRAGRISGREVVLRRSDGSTFTAALYAAAVRDAGGRLVEIQSHILDVSAAKAVEAQLRQSQKLEALGRLAGGVAHDFNNLLTAISGYTDMLRRSLDPADARRAWCEEVVQTTERAAGLTRQLLAFGRQQVVQPAPMDVGAAVRAMTRMIQRIVGEDVALRVDVEPGPCIVLADRNQVEQVLLNLAVNARDAMPGGGAIDVRVRTVERAATPPRCVEIAVSDGGVGMSREVQERMFEPFFTTKEHGTGLGLATVYGIVRQAGGEIEVESAVGRGSTFRVLLPATSGPAAPEGPAPSDEPDIVSAGRGLVLLAEDEPAVRQLACRALEAAGYTVVAAENGARAIACLDQGTVPDVVVTDVVMPEAGGRALAEAVRERLPGVPVVFMSGYAPDDVLRAHLVDRPEAFLSKPFTPSMLLRKVAEALAGAARDPPSGAAGG